MVPLIQRLILLATAATAPVLAATAQDVPFSQIVFEESFEAGDGAWTATGLWTVADSADSCSLPAAPFPDGGQAAWYGIPTSCTYETGSAANSGTLSLDQWVDLPLAPSISLRFWMWIQSEYCWSSTPGGFEYDRISVLITREVGPTFTQYQCGVDGLPNWTLLPWHERRIDLSAYRGERVKIAFRFDTGDELGNAFQGWLIDDIQILAEPAERVCGDPGLSSGCPCGPAGVPVAGGCRNSTEQSSTLLSAGVPSVSADTLRFRAQNMPPNASAILTQSTGTGPAALFADGLRCISGQLRRMGSLTASGGAGQWPLTGESISVRGAIPPTGATRYYYVYYRDVQNYCTPATANLTDTHKITWVP